MREVVEERWRDQRDHPKSDRYGNDEQVGGVGLEVCAGQDTRAGRRDHAEHYQAGAPSSVKAF